MKRLVLWVGQSVIASSHWIQQPSMNKFINLLRSVDNIKAGNLISLFIRHSKIVQFMQFIMAVSVSYVYCFSLYAFYMSNIICVNYTLQNCLVYTIYNGCISARSLSVSLSLFLSLFLSPPRPQQTHTHTHTLTHTLTHTHTHTHTHTQTHTHTPSRTHTLTCATIHSHTPK